MAKWSSSGENVLSYIIETRRCQMGNLIKQEVANQIIRVEDNMCFSAAMEAKQKLRSATVSSFVLFCRHRIEWPSALENLSVLCTL